MECCDIDFIFQPVTFFVFTNASWEWEAEVRGVKELKDDGVDVLERKRKWSMSGQWAYWRNADGGRGLEKVRVKKKEEKGD